MASLQVQLACCYFSTQVLVIDDEPAIADSLRFTLGTTIKSFSDPQIALSVLANYSPQITEQRWLMPDQTSDQWDGLHKQPVMIDIKKIAALWQDKNRFNDISVVIVDYHMPEMNGLELLAKFKNKPFKKILLTGEGTTALAVQAFNDGLIDQFFRKDDPDLQTKLRQAVADLKQNYFIELCDKTLKLLEDNSAIFSTAAIAQWFYEKIAALQIQEFYLLDMQGSFLLIDKHQQRTHLLIYPKEYMDMLTELAKADHAPVSVINQLSERQGVPYFGEHRAYWQVKEKDWERYMKPLEKVSVDNATFYMSIF